MHDHWSTGQGIMGLTWNQSPDTTCRGLTKQPCRSTSQAFAQASRLISEGGAGWWCEPCPPQVSAPARYKRSQTLEHCVLDINGHWISSHLLRPCPTTVNFQRWRSNQQVDGGQGGGDWLENYQIQNRLSWSFLSRVIFLSKNSKPITLIAHLAERWNNGP